MGPRRTRECQWMGVRLQQPLHVAGFRGRPPVALRLAAASFGSPLHPLHTAHFDEKLGDEGGKRERRHTDGRTVGGVCVNLQVHGRNR